MRRSSGLGGLKGWCNLGGHRRFLEFKWFEDVLGLKCATGNIAGFGGEGLGAGFTALDLVFRVHGPGSRVWGSRFRVLGLSFSDLGFKSFIRGLGSSVSGEGFGFRI